MEQEDSIEACRTAVTGIYKEGLEDGGSSLLHFYYKSNEPTTGTAFVPLPSNSFFITAFPAHARKFILLFVYVCILHVHVYYVICMWMYSSIGVWGMCIHACAHVCGS